MAEVCEGDSCKVEKGEESCECAGKDDCQCDKKEAVPESKIKTQEELDEVLTNSDWAIIEYYSPQCPHCQSLQPEIDKLVKEGEVPIYQVDCHNPESAELCQKAGIEGFPTIHFKSRATKCDYSGVRDSNSIKTAFLRIKDTKLDFEKVTKEELEEKILELLKPTESKEEKKEEDKAPMVEKVTVLVVSSLTSTEKLEEYKNMLKCESTSKVGLYMVDNLDLSEEKLILTGTLREFNDEERAGELKNRLSISLDGPNTIGDLMNLNSKADPFSHFEPMMLRYYLGFDKSFVFVILEEEGELTEEEKKEGKAPTYKNMQEIAEVFKENRENKLGPLVIGLHMDAKNPQHANFVNVLGMHGSFPDAGKKALILSLDKQKKQFVKYVLEKETTADNLREFLMKYENKELDPYFKSNPIPEKNEGEVLEEVVGHNYDAFIKRGEHKAVILVTYVPEATSPNKATGKALEIAKELAETIKAHYLDNNTSNLIKVGTFDVIANEHESIVPQLKPQILLFTENHPQGVAYEEFAEKGVDGVKDFIKEKTGISLVHVEEELGDEL